MTTAAECMKQFLELAYHAVLICFYFAYFLVKGRENDPVTYPSFACIDDYYSTTCSSSSVPFAPPVATNVCCLHGIQSKPASQISRSQAPITSELKAEAKSNPGEANWGWLSQLKRFAAWFQPTKRAESITPQMLEPLESPSQLFPSAHDSNGLAVPNGCPASGLVKLQQRQEQNWLKRYANFENMPKTPNCLVKQPSQESEEESTAETSRPGRTFKVVTQSSPQELVRLEQRPSVNPKLTDAHQMDVRAAPSATVVSVNLPLSAVPKNAPSDGVLGEPFQSFRKPMIPMTSQTPNASHERSSNMVLHCSTTSVSSAPVNLVGSSPARIFTASTSVASALTPIYAEPSTSDQPTVVHVCRRPLLTSTLSKQEEAEEDSTDSEEAMVMKRKVATIISVPTVVQHRGVTTVHMHLKRHELSMLPTTTAANGPRLNAPINEQIPVIVVHEEKSPERQQLRLENESVLQPSDNAQGDPCRVNGKKVRYEDQDYITVQPVSPPPDAPQPAYAVDEIWSAESSDATHARLFTAVVEDIPQPILEESHTIPASTYEYEEFPEAPPSVEAQPLIQPHSENSSEEGDTFPTPEIASEPRPIYTTIKFPSTMVPNFEQASESNQNLLTVGDIQQGLLPSSATGADTVKEVLEQPSADANGMLPVGHVQKMPKDPEVLKYNLFGDGVAEKVRACQSIAHELKASSGSGSTLLSKAQRMFSKRKQRSAKYIVSSPGPEVFPDSDGRNSKMDKTFTTTTVPDNGDPSKMTKKIRNQLGDVHDLQQMQKDYSDIITNLASAAKCQEISQALKSQTSSSRGAEMFGRRRQESKEWLVDEQPPTAASSQPAVPRDCKRVYPDHCARHTGVCKILAYTFDTSQRCSRQETQHRAGLPPIPVPIDQVRPLRRELERIPSPTPSLDWALHDRHERLFSPIPFSSRTRVPSLEKIVFSPDKRPFTPVVLGEKVVHPPRKGQTACRSSSIASDQFDPRGSIECFGHGVSANASPVLPRSSLRRRPMLPQRTQSFNILPRSWKSYHEAYQQRSSTEMLGPWTNK